jgi:phospholipid/cholesterol/gamma-HCH transport system ATP-binding protein
MISVQGVGKKFGETWVFRNVSFSAQRGSATALIGPSGSGKSTLLKTIAGLLTPNEGRVSLGSEDLGMLFQKNALFDSLTVEENLLFPLRERKKIKGAPARARAAELLNEVGLAGSEHLYPNQISGGMQKRLGIARALIVEPEILLYDEPTAGLDPITSRLIADVILRLKKKLGTTILTVTSDMQRAYQLGDTIYLLAQGRLLGGNGPDEIRRSEDPSIRQFIQGMQEGPLTAGLA